MIELLALMVFIELVAIVLMLLEIHAQKDDQKLIESEANALRTELGMMHGHARQLSNHNTRLRNELHAALTEHRREQTSLTELLDDVG